jgi:hypothetical protein
MNINIEVGFSTVTLLKQSRRCEGGQNKQEAEKKVTSLK